MGYQLMRALELKALQATTVSLQYSPLDPKPIDVKANVMLVEKIPASTVNIPFMPVEQEPISPTINSDIYVNEIDTIPETTVEVHSMPMKDENEFTCCWNPSVNDRWYPKMMY